MMQDLAPIYKKPEIKGFDQCHDLSIQKQVKKMNTIKVKLNTKDPKREREQKHVNLADDTVANIEIADIHHLGKGLIPLYTVLNSQSVNRAYHYKEIPKSGAIEFSKTHKCEVRTEADDARMAAIKKEKVNA